MTVKELIEQLQNENPRQLVALSCEQGHSPRYAHPVMYGYTMIGEEQEEEENLPNAFVLVGAYRQLKDV